MDSLSYKTKFVNDKTADRQWLIINAEGMIAGRLASKIAYLLRGKHKPSFTPFTDCGDRIIVINADKVVFSGNKWNEKIYTHHTGYPGGQIKQIAKDVHTKSGTKVVERAVRMMLPKNRLGDKIIRNLYVYAGSEHPHAAQNPQPFDIKL